MWERRQRYGRNHGHGDRRSEEHETRADTGDEFTNTDGKNLRTLTNEIIYYQSTMKL
jgi:hypothetical protein